MATMLQVAVRSARRRAARALRALQEDRPARVPLRDRVVQQERHQRSACYHPLTAAHLTGVSHCSKHHERA